MQRQQCWQWVVALSVVCAAGVACGDGDTPEVFTDGGEAGSSGSAGGGLAGVDAGGRAGAPAGGRSAGGEGGASGGPSPGCDALECAADAGCEIAGDQASCVCNTGFEGDGATCTDIDECDTGEHGCDPRAQCTNAPGGFACICPPDTLDVAGDGSDCSDGVCADENGGCDALTACVPTANGRRCGPCPSGYTGDGETGCSDIDECADDNGGCDWLTSCMNTIGDRICGDCPSGYTGDGARGCTDIDECEDDNGGCAPPLACLNLPGGRACGTCPQGYTGNAASGCVDIDECATNNGGCDPRVSCRNTPGARVCGSCPPGYTGSGTSGCVDIDECARNNGGCDPRTVCTNTDGSRSCGACPAGYTGSGATSCVDRDECALGTDTCHANAACTNTPGGFSCACTQGHYGNGATCSAARSCLDIRALVPGAPTGVHWLTAGDTPFRAYCDMTTQGGGWALALKIDGRLRTFNYEAALWTNHTLLSPNAMNVEATEAKLAPFNHVAFSEVMIRLEHPVGGTARTLRIAHAAPSLFHVFSRDTYVPTTALGRTAWKGLIGPTASLQAFCNREGFNVTSLETPAMYTRVRLGILSNQENDCLSADSYIGVGGLLSPCLAGTEPVAGGSAGCDPDNGSGHFPGFAWVFIR